jgi:type II secretory pathway pseudopilin PulG
MGTPNIFLNRKGINPLIIVIVLVIILIAMGGIVFTWMSLKERAGHAIQIQNVKFEETKTKIYVQNTGKGTVIIDSALINEERFVISKQNCIVTSQETATVEESQTAEITINQGYQRKIHIKVICKDGTVNEADWKP